MEDKCAFETCDRAVQIKKVGLCKSHYQQQHLGKELTPIRKKVTLAQPTPDTKICTRCMRVLTLDGFYKRKSGRPTAYCKSCMKDQIAEANRRRNQRRAAEKKAQAAQNNSGGES